MHEINELILDNVSSDNFSHSYQEVILNASIRHYKAHKGLSDY